MDDASSGMGGFVEGPLSSGEPISFPTALMYFAHKLIVGATSDPGTHAKRGRRLISAE